MVGEWSGKLRRSGDFEIVWSRELKQADWLKLEDQRSANITLSFLSGIVFIAF